MGDGGVPTTSGPESRPAPREVVETCLGAGIPTGLLIWFGLFPIAGGLTGVVPYSWVEAGGFGLSMDGLGVAMVLAAMVAAVYWRFPAVRRQPALLLRLTAALAVTTLLSVPLLTGVAAGLHYSTRPEALAIEAVLAGTVLAAALAVAFGRRRLRPTRG